MGGSKIVNKFVLYKIYYHDQVVYLGRTCQPLKNRLRGHFFSYPMHRTVSAEHVSKVEYAECKTLADMYLYEIYYINLLKPVRNRDDRAHDDLTVSLPELEFKIFDCNLMEKWKQTAKEEREKKEKEEEEKTRRFEERQRMRRTLSHEEYRKWLEDSEESK